MINISIISPVYNSHTYIQACIENVIAQRCEGIEHIIIDGGSTDGTVEIISQYASRYRHIRWISEKDQGQSDAMNKGIQMAQGEVISFLNADDFYEPGIFERVKQLLRTNSFPIPSVLIGKLNVIGQAGEVLEVQFTEKLSPVNVLRFWKRNIYPGNPACYFYHKKLHNQIGLYEVDDHLMMDYIFFIKASRVAHFYYFNEIWGSFRWIPGTKTFENNQTGKNWRLKIEVFHQYKKHLSLLDSLLLTREYNLFQRKNGKKRLSFSRRLLNLSKKLWRRIV